MNRVLIAAVAATAMFATPVFAQSAKFAASWDTEHKWATASDSCDTLACDALAANDAVAVDMPLATLKVPEGKEILIGVSAEIGVHLITEAKGGKKDVADTDMLLSSTAKAEGAVDVTLSLVSAAGDGCAIAPNDSVTMMSEMRELTVSGGGDWNVPTDEEFWINVKIESESIGAHHFEFLGVNCTQGDYTLYATFDLTALAEASGYDASAEDTVNLWDRIITMQEVRAVKGSLTSFD
jgi:hypothetical protein